MDIPTGLRHTRKGDPHPSLGPGGRMLASDDGGLSFDPADAPRRLLRRVRPLMTASIWWARRARSMVVRVWAELSVDGV